MTKMAKMRVRAFFTEAHPRFFPFLYINGVGW